MWGQELDSDIWWGFLCHGIRWKERGTEEWNWKRSKTTFLQEIKIFNLNSHKKNIKRESDCMVLQNKISYNIKPYKNMKKPMRDHNQNKKKY